MVSNALAEDSSTVCLALIATMPLESPVALRMSEDSLILSASEGHGGSATGRRPRPTAPAPQHALPESSSPPLAMMGAGDRAGITLEIFDDLAAAETEW